MWTPLPDKAFTWRQRPPNAAAVAAQAVGLADPLGAGGQPARQEHDAAVRGRAAGAYGGAQTSLTDAGMYNLSMDTYVWVCGSIYGCKYVWVCGSIYGCKYVCVCVCVCVYIYVYIYIYMYICMYI